MIKSDERGIFMLFNPLRSKTMIEKGRIIVPVLFLVLFCSTCYLVFLERSLPGNILKKALAHMENEAQLLDVVIYEEGEDYQLNFEGNILGNGVLYGKITDFDLELYSTGSGTVLVKDLKDGYWKESTELGLQSLTTFFLSPFGFLGSCGPLFQKAVFLDRPEETNALVSLQVTSEFLHKTALDKIDSLNNNEVIVDCLVSVNQEDFFIDAVLLSFVDKNTHKELFKRSFSFRPLDKSEIKNIYSSQL